MEGLGEIGERAREPGLQLVVRNVVPALGNSHRDPLPRDLHGRETDEAEHDGVACGFGLQNELAVPDGIGEHRLENEALPAPDELTPQRTGQLGRVVGAQVELRRQMIGLHEG
ncbi:MAG: hypothetical protein R2991_02650 [Thermoanaerobaculia bacterium]